ncbi:MAG: ATP-dependent zinc metalloprotease FtsH [Candidatus Aureabacteria bacterium]|nr:ATP-dependent zinc metalloprotease FtsH [Candidatus Auribacterota bacterium]
MMWIIILISVFTLFYLSKQSEKIKKLDYSKFISWVQDKRIIKAVIYNESGKVEGEYIKTDNDGKKLENKFETNRPTQDTSLYTILRDNEVEFVVKESNTLLAHFFVSFLPTVIIVLLLWFLITRQMRGIGKGTMGFAKSKAKLWNKEDSKITFEDVAGIDEAKEEVEEIIDFLKNPDKFVKLGGRIPKGVMLMGSPGTGKTLLAKAIAGEADVPFFSISGSDFVEMFVGVGASRVRDLFEQGKKNAPCIIFIDEIDAVGRHRGAGIGGGHDEREQTLNAILVEMDGFNTDKGVIIVAATNRPDVLDPALLRPGRFDRQIVINLPDLGQREKILMVHAKNVKMSEKVDLKTIARGTVYFSGADLANLINEAALLAAKRNKSYVEEDDLEEARDKILWGRERRSINIEEEEKKITAYHEAGHTIISEMLDHSEPVHKVSIIPRGQALGMTMQLPKKDLFIKQKSKLLNEVMILFGGRIAEEIIFNEISTGSSNDIKRSSQIIRKMVTQWGMSDKLGPITYGEREEHIFLGKEISRSIDYSNATAINIDEEVKSISDECYEKAKNIMKKNEENLHRLSDYLLKREVLTGEEVREIIAGKELPPIKPKKTLNKKEEEEKKPKEEIVSTTENKESKDKDENTL